MKNFAIITSISSIATLAVGIHPVYGLSGFLVSCAIGAYALMREDELSTKDFS